MLIEQLLSVDVVGVGAGAEHVVVVGGQGDVYAWGRGQGGGGASLVVDVKLLGLIYYGLKGGRLGLGTEEDVCTPKEVIFMENTKKDFCDEVKTSVDSLL